MLLATYNLLLTTYYNFIIFYKIAVWLNVFENHRTVQVHENRLIAKIFTFYFIDCFLWFFLLAFFQIPFGVQIDAVMNTTMHVALDKPFQKEIWMSRLGQTIGAVRSLVITPRRSGCRASARPSARCAPSRSG